MTVFDETKPTFGTFEDRAVWLIEKLLGDFPKWGPRSAPLGCFACAGNFGRESGIQMIQEGGQTPPNGGWGLAQWTASRRMAFSNYCLRSGRDPNAMSTGYAYTFVELTGQFAGVIDLVAAAPDLASKVSVFEQHFEMAGVVALSDRVAFAVRAQKAWEAHLAASPVPTTTPAPIPVPTTTLPPPATTPAPTKGTTMFNIGSIISLITSAPSIIESVMKLITEIEAGYAQGKASGGDPIVIFEDILAQLVNNKGAVAVAVRGPEPTVTAAGQIVPAVKVAVK